MAKRRAPEIEAEIAELRADGRQKDSANAELRAQVEELSALVRQKDVEIDGLNSRIFQLEDSSEVRPVKKAAKTRRK